MALFYGLQAAQMNEKSPLKSSLNLTFMQHPCDENIELRELRAHFKVETPSSLVLLHFSKLSHLGDLITSRPYFW
jgi:hypothetical protein